NPNFFAPECTQCLAQFTGLYCDQCANDHFAEPDCTECLPAFEGFLCDACVDEAFTGPDCDQCADDHFAAPGCTECLPEFTGPSCADCANPHFVPPECTSCVPIFTGDDCQSCTNPKYAAPDCTSCLPQFTGDNCSACVDPHFTGPDCETCAEGLSGADCDQCADPAFIGADCDQCADQNFAAPACQTCVPGYTGPNCDECDGVDCVDPIGCADGTRDELTDIDQWPTVAACEGTFGFMSLRAERTGAACGDALGVECAAPEDLCSPGWHICMRNGQALDLQYRLSWQECHSLSKPFVAASNNCSNPSGQNPAGPGCNMAEPLGCYTTGWCSAPPVCGPFETSHCAHAIWPTKTYIFGKHAGKTTNKGCGHISTSVSIKTWSNGPTVPLAGVLCCRD
ncbi:MAG: hypothetical protein QF464_15350, partial [Myxococcota bacterium]|nr:hypothetical protein [Myxococcota bacterium]